MIKLESVGKTFGENVVLNNINLHIEKGTFYGIVGTNGVGKTTLVKIIAGLLTPTEGKVNINGYQVDLNSNKVEIGFIPDSPTMYDYLTGEEYLYFASAILDIQKDKIDEKVSFLLKKFNLYQAKDKLIAKYSNGMKQKLSIASVIISEPEILILDEPLTGVDMISSNVIKDYLKSFVEKGSLVLMTTHILELAHNTCDRIGILNQGTLATEFDVANHTIAEMEEKIRRIYIENNEVS
ncbi:ABC transporter ATP-binding protein [Sediminibacillus massiliensis]|uniref:ABC transporter ATP-binding protein n=1 Tax=Sediminibacillus massiliensis TaxID=1926277 RepID=UPI00098835BA|nr:ABC transporter ATP-binding protein [Sediminibacillus massiliensis]